MESRRVSSFIEQLSLAMHAMPEALRQIVHQHEVDDQQRSRILVEIEVKLRPLAPIDCRRLDREVDVRAPEMVAAGARAEQPDPLDRRMGGKAPGQLEDQLATREIGGQGRCSSPLRLVDRCDDSTNRRRDASLAPSAVIPGPTGRRAGPRDRRSARPIAGGSELGFLAVRQSAPP
jgi:hypothetical protein